MGLLDGVMGWFRKEAGDVRSAMEDLEGDLGRDMDRKERELAASPEEKMATIQQDSAAEKLLAELRSKFDRAEARASATGEVANIDRPTDPVSGSD